MTQDDDGNRGTGRTTALMKAAPKGSLYIWCNEDTSYPRQLSRDLGREDLNIIKPTQIGNARGILHAVVDHAARLTEDQQKYIATYFNR